MAEIRSTMDMVMERAAKMAAESTKSDSSDDAVRQGMRLAAEHLQKGETGLLKILKEQKQEEQMGILKGMTDTLLRNIVLPREEHLQENNLKALEAISEIAPGEISSICGELQQILSQYNQHKDQMVQQLDDAIRAQLKQKLAEQGAEVADDMAINPTMHPQYQEELGRMLADLNGQYNEALDQRKAMIKQRLAPSV